MDISLLIEILILLALLASIYLYFFRQKKVSNKTFITNFSILLTIGLISTSVLLLLNPTSSDEFPNRPLSEYWNIKTWIRWKDNFNGLNSGNDWETLEYEVNQIAIR